MNTLPHWTAVRIEMHLDEIARLFKNAKTTLLIRTPDFPEGDVLMTDDDHGEILAAFRRRLPGLDETLTALARPFPPPPPPQSDDPGSPGYV